MTFTNNNEVQHIGPGLYRAAIVFTDDQGRAGFIYKVPKLLHWEAITTGGKSQIT